MRFVAKERPEVCKHGRVLETCSRRQASIFWCVMQVVCSLWRALTRVVQVTVKQRCLVVAETFCRFLKHLTCRPFQTRHLLRVDI